MFLNPGSYEISVSAPGLARTTLRGIVLTVGSAFEQAVVLDIDKTAQTLDVTAPAVGLEFSAPAELVRSGGHPSSPDQRAAVSGRRLKGHPATV